MSVIKPLVGLRPDPRLASAVASVPYDVVDTEEARTLAEDNPDSFLRISRSEIELDREIDPYSPTVYQLAKNNLELFTNRGTLIVDNQPVLYLYQLSMPLPESRGFHTQTGLMGGFSVHEYRNSLIKTHEKTRVDKENDRTRHILKLRAHTEPVLLAYRELSQLSETIERLKGSTSPLYDFQSGDGIRHTVWRIGDCADLIRYFNQVPALYIADGHHRAASAARVADTLTDESIVANNPQGTKTGNRSLLDAPGYSYFLAVAFPDSQLRILPYNRIVKKLPLPASELLSRLSENFEVVDPGTPVPTGPREFSMFIENRWCLLRPKQQPVALDLGSVESLDVSVLYNLALAPIFGIGDQRTDKNIEFVGGIHGSAKLEQLVKVGAAECAFSMYPVSLSQLFEVSDKGLLMPPKSTWFEPKLRSGLFVHKF